MRKLDLIKLILESEESEGTQKQQGGIASSCIGKVCMFRTYSAGVHFGTLVEKEGQSCKLSNARRVWYWSKAASLSELSQCGSGNISECKIAVTVSEIIIEQVIEIIPMTEKAIKLLGEAPEWKA